MIILAVETSCDETSIAILEDKKVLSNVTISQVLEQQKYGGVVPSLAAKLHLENIQKVLKNALFEARVEQNKIDYIAYTPYFDTLATIPKPTDTSPTSTSAPKFRTALVRPICAPCSLRSVMPRITSVKS